MIYAIGHDIVEVNRIKKLLQRYPLGLTNKVLSLVEREICTKHSHPSRYIAKRFAAKEAFAKACGTGMRSPILMPDITIINNNLGKPEFCFSPSIQLWLGERKIINHHLSLSDEINLASAFVVLEY